MVFDIVDKPNFAPSKPIANGPMRSQIMNSHQISQLVLFGREISRMVLHREHLEIWSAYYHVVEKLDFLGVELEVCHLHADCTDFGVETHELDYCSI